MYSQYLNDAVRQIARQLKKMISIGCILLLIICFYAAGVVAAERFPSIYTDSALKETVLLGIDYTIREKYDLADSLFAELSRRYPRSPIGALFRAAALQTRMLDRENGADWPRLKVLIDEAIQKSENWKKAAPEDPEPYFFQAGAYGYWAVYESHWGGWFAALKTGLKAANRFKHAVELDPTFIDAYLGLGSYQYWKSAKTTFINWLPIISDDRQKGIKNLERAVKKGIFVRQTAETALMWTLLDYGFSEKALAIAHKLHEEYPETKAFLWGIGLSALEAYRWRECIEAFDTLEARITLEGAGNYYNLIECAYYKTEAAFNAGDYDRCRAECRRAFSYPVPGETKKRLKGKLSRLEKRYHELGKQAGK
jgi:tetratricopeptide (TPR) repeat protein